MDDFLEQVVERKNRGAFNALYYISWMLLVAFAFVGLINAASIVYTNEAGSLSVSIPAIVQAVAFLGVAFLLWRGAYRLRVEYDYSFTNGSIDVAMVLNRTKRKPLTSVDTMDLRAAGEARGNAFEKFAREPNVKTHKWYLNRDAKLYFFYFEKKGGKHLMLLELSEEMAGLIFARKYMPVGVWDAAYKSA